MTWYQFSSVAQSCPTLYNPMDCNMIGCPVHHQLLDLAQTHVYRVMASKHLILCRPLLLQQSFPGSGSYPRSQFFTSDGQSIGVSSSTSVLPMNIQDWFPLRWTGWISWQSKGPQKSSSTPQFKSINSSALSFLYSPTITSMHDHCKNNSLD